MKKTINREEIRGYVYDHDLQISQVKNPESPNFGKDFIKGKLQVAVDDEALNVVDINYTYVAPITSKNTPNTTFTNLKRIIDENATWISKGKNGSLKVSCSPSLGLNEFYTKDGQFVSREENSGGFVTIISNIKDTDNRNKFTVDILITKISRIEADEEKHIKNDYVAVKGGIFDFANRLLPVTLKVTSEAGMKYFENLDASSSNPLFTKVWGNIISETIVDTRTEKSAFGEDSVVTYSSKMKDWVITGMLEEDYGFGSEDTITADEVKKAMKDREVYLATLKKNREEWDAKTNAATGNSTSQGSSNMAISTGDFKF